MCFPNNPKTFKSTFVSKTSQAITKVCTCIWSACGRPGASVGRSSTWTSCCTGRTGSRCRPSKRCLAQKRDKLRQLTSRALLQALFNKAVLRGYSAGCSGQVGVWGPPEDAMRQESKSHRVRGLSLKVVGLNPKTSKDFSSEIYVDNYSPTFFFCLPNFMWQIINLCKSVSTKLQIAHIKEIKKPNVSKKLRNHCITIQS